jgi:hypothetical protein
MHIGNTDKCNWIRERVENPRWLHYDKEKKSHIFERLCFADTFENFLANKFNTTKRFGLDGGEAVVPGLKDAIDRASELGAHSFVIGMPHRGRLNVLANVMRKPMPLIFSEFQGTHYELKDHDKSRRNKSDDHLGFSGDVKCKWVTCTFFPRNLILYIWLETNDESKHLTFLFIYLFFNHRSFRIVDGSYISGWSKNSFKFSSESITFGMC